MVLQMERAWWLHLWYACWTCMIVEYLVVAPVERLVANECDDKEGTRWILCCARKLWCCWRNWAVCVARSSILARIVVAIWVRLVALIVKKMHKRNTPVPRIIDIHFQHFCEPFSPCASTAGNIAQINYITKPMPTRTFFPWSTTVDMVLCVKMWSIVGMLANI